MKFNIVSENGKNHTSTQYNKSSVGFYLISRIFWSVFITDVRKWYLYIDGKVKMMNHGLDIADGLTNNKDYSMRNTLIFSRHEKLGLWSFFLQATK